MFIFVTVLRRRKIKKRKRIKRRIKKKRGIKIRIKKRRIREKNKDEKEAYARREKKRKKMR